MPDTYDSTFADRDNNLGQIEAKSRARASYRAVVTPDQARIANRVAFQAPQVARQYPGAVAIAAQTGNDANADAVVQEATKAKNDSGDWWDPGDIVGAVGSALESGASAVGGVAATAVEAVGSAASTVAAPVTRAATAAAQSAYQFGTNIWENRAPLSSDVEHMALGNTKADEAARQQESDRLKRIAGGTDSPLGGFVGIAQQAQATDVGQVVTQVAQGGVGAVDMGSGFFPGGSVATGQAEAARQVRGVIPGTNQARTPGRELAVTYTEPGTTAYQVLSGMVDAGSVVLFDPVTHLHPFKGLLNQSWKTPDIANANFVDDAKGAVETASSWVTNHPKATDAIRTSVEEVKDRLHTALDAGDVKGAKKAANVLSGLVSRVEPGAADDVVKFKAGMIDGLRKTVHAPTAEQFIQQNEGLWQRFADDNSFTSIFHRLGGKVDPRIVMQLTDASTPEDVVRIMRGALGGEIIKGPGLAYRGPLGEAMTSFGDWVAEHRVFRSMPGGQILTDVRGATSEELSQSVRRLEDALTNARVPIFGPEGREALIENYVRALSGTSQDVYAAHKAALEAVRAQIQHGSANVPEAAARGIVNRMSDDINTIRSYAKDAAGNPTDHGLADALGRLDDAGESKLPGIDIGEVHSPISLEHGIRRAVDLPDPRQIRRLTTHPVFRALTTKGVKEGVLDPFAYGQANLPLATVDWMTNQFKRLAVLRGAFIPRVVGEEMVYLGIAGGPSPFRHPVDFLALAGSKDWRAEDVLGSTFMRAAKGTAPKELDDFQRAINVGIDQGSDPYASSRFVHAAGDASIAHKAADSERWMQGHSDHLAAAHSNPLKRMVAEGSSTEDIVAYLRSAKGKADLNELDGMIGTKGKGIRYTAPDGSHTIRMKLDLSSDAVLKTYIDTYVRGDVARLAGNNPHLLEVISKGHLGFEEIPIKNSEIAGVISRVENPEGGFAWAGTRVRLKDGRLGTVVSADDKGQSVIQVGSQAWTDREMSPTLRTVLEDWRKQPESAERIDVWTRPAERRALKDGDIINNALSRVSSLFFGHLYGKTSDYLVRAPFFKATYWDEMDRLMPNLSPSEANKALKSLESHLGEGTRLADSQLDRLIARAKTANGTLDLEAADALAKGRALDTMHDTFYNWSRKGQFFDITRNIFPFGEAWKEMLTRYARLLKEDPLTTLRKVQLLVNGKNSSGFFSRDETTGQENFNMPLVGPLAKILTGADVQAHASVAGLTIGGSVIPGLSPIAAIGVAHFLPDLPETDALEQTLFPYGRPKTSPTALLPSWMQNLQSALFDKRNTVRLFGNTYHDVFKALAATGDYDLSKQEEVTRLMDDASRRARLLSTFKVALQFVSPSSPAFDQVVHTKGGDVLSGMLIDDLDAMRKADPKNYTASFLAKYGDKAFIYLQGRTRATVGGIEPTDTFGAWEQTHPEAMGQYPDVAGYFAPTGGDFDFEVWRRQINKGERIYLSDREIIDAAQATMGRWNYYAVRDAMGPKLSSQQRVALAQLRDLLRKKYPGYDPSGDSTPSKVNARVDKLHDAAKSKELRNTEVGKALGYYFEVRDAVQAQARKSGISSFADAKAFAPQREALRGLGELLTQKYPSFGRVWDEVLDREMAPDTTEPADAQAAA